MWIVESRSVLLRSGGDEGCTTAHDPMLIEPSPWASRRPTSPNNLSQEAQAQLLSSWPMRAALAKPIRRLFLLFWICHPHIIKGLSSSYVVQIITAHLDGYLKRGDDVDYQLPNLRRKGLSHPRVYKWMYHPSWVFNLNETIVLSLSLFGDECQLERDLDKWSVCSLSFDLESNYWLLFLFLSGGLHLMLVWAFAIWLELYSRVERQ